MTTIKIQFLFCIDLKLCTITFSRTSTACEIMSTYLLLAYVKLIDWYNSMYLLYDMGKSRTDVKLYNYNTTIVTNLFRRSDWMSVVVIMCVLIILYAIISFAFNGRNKFLIDWCGKKKSTVPREWKLYRSKTNIRPIPRYSNRTRDNRY